MWRIFVCGYIAGLLTIPILKLYGIPYLKKKIINYVESWKKKEQK